VAITSPGRRVCDCESVLIKLGMVKIRSSVVPFCRSSPLTCVVTVRIRGNADFGKAIGPIGQYESPLLPAKLLECAILISREAHTNKELLVISLLLAGRHIVDDRIAPYVLFGLCL